MCKFSPNFSDLLYVFLERITNWIIYLIEVQLIYNIALALGVQQKGFSYIWYIHIYFRIFFIICYNKMLNVVPCVYSKSLFLIYFIYGSLCLWILYSQFIPPPAPFPSVIRSLFSMSVSLFLFVYRLICIIFLSHIQVVLYNICLCPIYFTEYNIL